MATIDRYEEDRKWFWEEQRKIQERSRKEQMQKQDIPETKSADKQNKSGKSLQK